MRYLEGHGGTAECARRIHCVRALRGSSVRYAALALAVCLLAGCQDVLGIDPVVPGVETEEPCEGSGDGDADGVCDVDDRCDGGDDRLDGDGDDVPDACDVCPEGDDAADADEDTVPDACDQCADADDRLDRDSDGLPDACDPCPDSGAACASCADILAGDPTARDGSYTIDPDGLGSSPPRSVLCDMTTDGGGWTEVALWNRGADPVTHTLASLLGVFVDELAAADDPNVSPMSDLIELDDQLRWSDFNATADALSFRLDIDIPNTGDLRVDIGYRGVSMENSAVWFFATAGGEAQNIQCSENATAGGAYTLEEFALIPYDCGSPADLNLNGFEERAFGAQLSAFTVRSLHYDSNLGDHSLLSRLVVFVR